MRAQIWISAIIYTLVAVIALVIILNTGIPILTEMKDKATYTKVKDVMLDLDRQLSDIAAQGEGSQAEVSFEIRDGELYFYDDQLVWELETKSELISPRTSTRQGNLIIASNANVKTIETDTSYVLQTNIKGDTFRAEFNKWGSEGNTKFFNTSQVIRNISFNDQGMPGVFKFNLNDDPDSREGFGYTEMVPSGNNSNLGVAKVIAHMDTDFAVYDLEFTLQSYADFVLVNVKNFEPK